MIVTLDYERDACMSLLACGIVLGGCACWHRSALQIGGLYRIVMDYAHGCACWHAL